MVRAVYQPRGVFSEMSTHIELACPKCHEALRVRREYVGKRVTCKHCQQTFKVWDPDEPSADLTSPPPLEGVGPASARGGDRDAEVARLRQELATAVAELESLRGGKLVALSAELAELRAERGRLAEELASARAQTAGQEAEPGALETVRR